MGSRKTVRPGNADWQAIHARLSKATATTQEALSHSPERARAVMEERARALARAPACAATAGQMLEVITFELARERYAVETRHVQEVTRLSDYAPVPGAPAFLLGVVNLRGELLAVIDLRKFFVVAQRGVTDLSRVIVLGGERPEFGVLADAVHEVIHLRTDKVLEPPESVAGIGRDYLRGVTEDALIVLDGAVLLKDGRLFVYVEEDKQ